MRVPCPWRCAATPSTIRTSRGRLCTESCFRDMADQFIGVGIADHEGDDPLAEVVVGVPPPRPPKPRMSRGGSPPPRADAVAARQSGPPIARPTMRCMPPLSSTATSPVWYQPSAPRTSAVASARLRVATTSSDPEPQGGQWFPRRAGLRRRFRRPAGSRPASGKADCGPAFAAGQRAQRDQRLGAAVPFDGAWPVGATRPSNTGTGSAARCRTP